MGPIDYLGAVPQQDFLRDIQGGLQLGMAYRQNQVQQQQQQRAQQYQADATAFYQQPSPQAALALSLKYPEQAEPITKAYGSFTADQQKVALQDTATLANLLHAGRADLADNEISKRIEAAKNSGLPTGELEALQTLVSTDPKGAYAHVLHSAAALPGGDKILTSLEGLNKDARDQTESDSKVAGDRIKQAGEAAAITGAKAGALAQAKNLKPSQVETFLRSEVAAGRIPKEELADRIAAIPTDSKGLPDYLKQIQASGMKPDDQMKFTTPTADATLSATTQRRGQDIQHQQWVQEQEDANTPGKANEALAQRIAKYKQAPLGQFALNKPWGQATMDRVAELNPEFDAATYPARAAAIKSFTNGTDGKQIESANIAMNHLATLKELALAQKNGKTQLFNKLANQWASATGNPAPTNLAAAAQMIGPEVVKTVSGVAGTGEERAHIEKVLTGNGNYSPDQILGAVGTAQELFGGRLKEKKRSYMRATKLDDFEETFLSPAARELLTGKGETKGVSAAKSAHPDDIDYLLNKYGSK